MKAITKNLLTYQADIHAEHSTLEERLGGFGFAPCGEHQRHSYGFVPFLATEQECSPLVKQFPGGWALCFREDSRAVPASEVNKAVEAKVAEIKESVGRTAGKKERQQIKADVIYDLLPRAFVRTKVTQVVYSAKNRRLYINTNSQKTADTVVTALVNALQSVKFSTVYVSEPKMGLTARLINWLDEKDDSEAFGPLHPVNEAVMEHADRKWSVKDTSLRNADQALREAVSRGAKVDSLGFMDEDGVRFRITAALRIKGVKHNTVDDDEDTTVDHALTTQLASEVVTLDNILDTLLELLCPEKAQASSEEADLFGEA